MLEVGAADGLYVHVPFCFHKCHYCDFYSIVDDRDRQGAFARRLADELRALGGLDAGPLQTLFVGGGTPTLLAAGLWRTLLGALHDAFSLAPHAEFTVEANPETVDAHVLDALVSGGVNRLSIGAQSFNAQHLKTLERWHDPRKVAAAVEAARRAGIARINLDLIFGIPGQSLDHWDADLEAALALGPTHLSCYGLTYEPNTAMTQKVQLGRVTPLDDHLEAAMYRHTIDKLAAAGYEHYEISNWAKRPAEPAPGSDPGPRGHGPDDSHASSHRCRHNLMYWRNGQWLAAGPGAAGHVAGVRWKNQPHLGRYLAHDANGAPVDPVSVERLSPDASLGEQLMLRLRLIDGVPIDWLHRPDPRLADRLASRRPTIERLIADGLLERTASHVRLSPRGLMLADSVIGELL